ncbi:alpha/beta fold hydrolase [Thalassiella azotivora]
MPLTRFERAGLTFDVRDAGPADGVPVVLLHGFPQDSASWDRVAPLLHAEGLRTLAPDQRGYSPAARPTGRGAYRMGELVRDVLALLDAADLPSAHVVGHDWGGAVAWAVGTAAPGRVRSLTVLSTPHPSALIEASVRSDQALRSWYMGLFQLPYLPERLLAGRVDGLLRRAGLPADDAQRYARRMAEPGALTAALGWYRAMPLSFRSAAHPVTVPTTYVWGAKDTALGRTAAERTALHVRAPYRFEVLDAGHWLPEKRPDDVAAAVVRQVREAGGE